MTRPRMGRRWGRRPQQASGSKCWARASRNKQRSISTGICSYQASMMPSQRPSCWKTSGSAETAALIWSLCFAKALRKRRRRNGATWPATWKPCQETSEVWERKDQPSLASTMQPAPRRQPPGRNEWILGSLQIDLWKVPEIAQVFLRDARTNQNHMVGLLFLKAPISPSWGKSE